MKCAVVTAETPLVTPGPAVSTARPGVRVSLARPSAAKTAVCSWRTSTRRIGAGPPSTPALPPTAASYRGNTWAPDSVNIVSTPYATAAATACVPPCPWLPPWPLLICDAGSAECVLMAPDRTRGRHCPPWPLAQAQSARPVAAVTGAVSSRGGTGPRDTPSHPLEEPLGLVVRMTGEQQRRTPRAHVELQARRGGSVGSYNRNG